MIARLKKTLFHSSFHHKIYEKNIPSRQILTHKKGGKTYWSFPFFDCKYELFMPKQLRLAKLSLPCIRAMHHRLLRRMKRGRPCLHY